MGAYQLSFQEALSEYDLEVDWLNLKYIIILMTFIAHGLRPKASVSELSVWIMQGTKRIKAKQQKLFAEAIAFCRQKIKCHIESLRH